MNVRDIKSRVIDKGLAHKNRFEVFIPGFGEESLLATDCNIPQITLNSTPYRQFPPGRQDINDIEYTDLNIKFLVDSNYNIRILLENWLEQIFNLEDGTWNFRKEYTKDLTINLLDRRGNIKLIATFFDCNPKVIGNLDQSFESENEIQTIETTFAYRYYSLTQQPNTQFDIPFLDQIQDGLEIAEGVRDEVRIIDETINRTISSGTTLGSRLDSLRRL